MVTGVFPSPPRYVPSFLSHIGVSIPIFQLLVLLDFRRICYLSLSRFPLVNLTPEQAPTYKHDYLSAFDSEKRRLDWLGLGWRY